MKDLRFLWAIHRRGAEFVVSQTKDKRGHEFICYHAGSEEQAKSCARAMAEDFRVKRDLRYA